MEMKKCSSGQHYYDASIYSECPYCKANAEGTMEGATMPLNGGGIGATVPLNNGGGIGVTMPLNNGGGIGVTMPLNNGGGAGAAMPLNNEGAQDGNHTAPLGYDAAGRGMQQSMWENQQGGRTVAVIREELGMDPIVGWLVCVKGPDRGKDFRLHSDYNYIGRSERMDICVHDDTISKENHAVVAFDTKDCVFYFGPAGGRGIVRINGKALLSTAEIKIYDRLEIGRSVFVFVPLCGETFSWQNEEEK